MVKTEAFENSTLFTALTTKNGYKAGKLYSLKASDGDGDFVWDRNSPAYRLNQEGLMEEMVTDVPRVDYTNTCPELLIEGQSTNIIHRSQDISAAAWTKVNSPTITSNIDVAPDGTTTADGIQSTSGGSYRVIAQSHSCSPNSTYTFSVYVKKETTQTGYAGMEIVFLGTSVKSALVIINEVLGTYHIYASSITPVVKVESIGNYWRFDMTATDTGANTTVSPTFYATLSNDGTTLGNGAGSLRTVWGFQLENLPYATSYIHTPSNSSVTRVRDIATNITTDFTSLKGTIFVRCRVQDSASPKVDSIISMIGTDMDNYIYIYSTESRDLYIQTFTNPDENEYYYSLASDGIYNIAVGYDFSGANNKLNIAINGVLERANATQANNAPTILDTMFLGSIMNNNIQIDNRIIGVMWFDSQLSDTDIVNITA